MYLCFRRCPSYLLVSPLALIESSSLKNTCSYSSLGLVAVERHKTSGGAHIWRVCGVLVRLNSLQVQTTYTGYTNIGLIDSERVHTYSMYIHAQAGGTAARPSLLPFLLNRAPPRPTDTTRAGDHLPSSAEWAVGQASSSGTAGRNLPSSYVSSRGGWPGSPT